VHPKNIFLIFKRFPPNWEGYNGEESWSGREGRGEEETSS
jgi:hypothetical protein